MITHLTSSLPSLNNQNTRRDNSDLNEFAKELRHLHEDLDQNVEEELPHFKSPISSIQSK